MLTPSSSAGKESACDAGDPSSIPGSGKFHEEGIGYQLQYSWASLVAQLVKKKVLPQCSRPGFNPWVGKIPRRRGRLPTPVLWPGEFHELYSPWGHKELDMLEQLSILLNVTIKLKKFYLKKKSVAHFTCACRGTAHPAPWKTKITLCFKKETTVLQGGKKKKEYYPSERQFKMAIVKKHRKTQKGITMRSGIVLHRRNSLPKRLKL